MYNKIKYLLRLLSFIPIITFIIVSQSQGSQPKDRYRACNEFAKPEGIAQPVLIMSEEDRDLEVDFNNPICIAEAVTLYLAIKASLEVATKACGVSYNSALVSPIADSIAIAQVNAALLKSSNPACISSTAAVNLAVTGFTGVALVTRTIAASEFKKYRICGSNWKEYNTESWKKSNYGHAQNALDAFNTWKNDPSSQNPEDIKEVREWLYQGIERESKECTDKDGNPLKYYYRGFLPASNNCKQYLENNDKNAYD